MRHAMKVQSKRQGLRHVQVTRPQDSRHEKKNTKDVQNNLVDN